MDKSKGNMPDFEQLTDRLIAEPSNSPGLVIKTNVDPKNVTEENPYAKEQQKTTEEFENFFDPK